MRYLINRTTGPENDIRTVFERSKIARLCYSQRLVYEISPNGNTTENYAYCYQQCQGEYMIDQGRTVLLANDPAQQYPFGYYIARDVYENLQHSFLPYPWQEAENWIIKPVMRIDPNVVINYPEKEVVRIEIKKFNGELFDPVIIKAKHFKNSNGEYNGEYRDNYYFRRCETVGAVRTFP